MGFRLLLLAIPAFCYASAQLHAQSFFERLEQRVRERLEQVEDPVLPSAQPGSTENNQALDSETRRNSSRPSLGLIAEQRDGVLYPVTVVEIASGSIAANAGIRPGDQIVAIDEQPVGSLAQLRAALAESSAGEAITIRIMRSGRPIEIPVVLAAGAADETLPPPRPVPEAAQRPLALGVNVESAATLPSSAPVRQGAVIVSIEEGSLVGQSGLEVGDVIVAWNGRVITSASDFAAAAANHAAGNDIELTFYHGTQLKRVVLTPAAAEPSPAARGNGLANDSAGEGERGGQLENLLGGIGRILGGASDDSFPPPARPVGESPPPPPAADQADVVSRMERLERQMEQIIERLDRLESRLETE